jgi:hypothetical protein
MIEPNPIISKTSRYKDGAEFTFTKDESKQQNPIDLCVATF